MRILKSYKEANSKQEVTEIHPNNIKKIRKEKGMLQKELALRSNISVYHLNKLENGKRELNLKVAAKIARVLDVSLQDLFF